MRIQAERKLAEVDGESSEEDISEDQRSVCSKVRSWISRQSVQEEPRVARNKDERIYSSNPPNPRNTAPLETQNEREGVRLGERIKSPHSPNPQNELGLENRMDRYIARQIMGKDLPNFSGEEAEWPLFISTYRQSTGAVSAYYDPLLEGKHGKESRSVLTFADDNDQRDLKCAYCKKGHAIGTCTSFRKLDTDSRWKWATEKRVCFKCLSKKHLLRQCKRKQCQENQCTKAHHPLSHYERRETVTPEKASNAESTSSSVEKVNIVRKVKNDDRAGYIGGS